MEINVVADWFVNEPKAWNEDLLRLHLYEFEVREILRIPLCATDECDNLVWNPTRDRCYTVKSGYHFIRSQKEIKKGSGASSEGRGLWSRIWKLELPPKIKNFIWRVCKGALPCGINVQKCVVEADPTCQRCLRDIESEVHALVGCPFAQEVWEVASMDDELFEAGGGGRMVNTVDFILKRLQHDEVCRFMVVLWACWNGRNKAYHSDEQVEPQVVLEKAMSFWHSWRVVHCAW
ncbi:uncharacterized protein LOC141620746 [Silene latifolia]|uniref:uncharacterized protein LOC141620746 n=1 Tax=Silene latifolia TaxID=37657 RepID=UPI003D76DD5E